MEEQNNKKLSQEHINDKIVRTKSAPNLTIVLGAVAAFFAIASVVFLCLWISKDGSSTTKGSMENDSPDEISVNDDGYLVVNGVKTEYKVQEEMVDENPQGLSFALKDDGTYAVEIGKAKYLSKIEIPGTYNGKRVTEVANFGGDEFNPNKYLKEIIISENITNINNLAFAFCPNLEIIKFPESLISIGKYAFAECGTLKEITIPNNLQIVGEEAFSGCEGLEAVYITDLESWVTIDFGDPNNDYNFGSGLLEYAKLYLNNELITSIIIPDGIEKIGAGAFADYKYINEISIPDSVTVIGNGAFVSCENLKTVTLGTNVKKIGSYAFYHCKKLAFFTMGENVERIGRCAFNYCPIDTLVIPDTLTDVGSENYITVTNLHVSSSEMLELVKEKWSNLKYVNLYVRNVLTSTNIAMDPNILYDTNVVNNEKTYIFSHNSNYYLNCNFEFRTIDGTVYTNTSEELIDMGIKFGTEGRSFYVIIPIDVKGTLIITDASWHS